MLLLPVACSLSGCSVKGLNLLDSPATRTPAIRASLTATVAAPRVLNSGYDSFAGNCPDAADEDAALIGYANSQNYNFDMQLRINPTEGCAADTKSATFKGFIRQVSQAQLTLNALDTAWVYNTALATRDTFLTAILQQLQAHYPSLSDVTIVVNYGGQPQARVTYNGHGAPVVTDPYNAQ